jgi:predicted short-subunit dehydrogenase-like oxidoreductase (DUF2520 family)
MQFNIIGAGALGLTLAYALEAKTKASLQAVCNSSLLSAQKSCEALGFGRAVSRLADLPPADLTFITCKDDSIALVVAELAEKGQFAPHSLVVHCSGVLDSSILAPLKQLGCSIASFHPLRAFRNDHLDAEAFAGRYCVLEGDTEACHDIETIFEPLGAKIMAIKPQGKVAYHAAACMLFNYSVTLAACSEALLQKAGIPAGMIQEMICNQIQNTLDNLRQSPNIGSALTGPLKRGDEQTIALHLQAIEEPTIKALYQAAGLATLDLTALSEEKKQAIKRLLTT